MVPKWLTRLDMLPNLWSQACSSSWWVHIAHHHPSASALEACRRNNSTWSGHHTEAIEGESQDLKRFRVMTGPGWIVSSLGVALSARSSTFPTRNPRSMETGIAEEVLKWWPSRTGQPKICRWSQMPRGEKCKACTLSTLLHTDPEKILIHDNLFKRTGDVATFPKNPNCKCKCYDKYCKYC